MITIVILAMLRIRKSVFGLILETETCLPSLIFGHLFLRNVRKDSVFSLVDGGGGLFGKILLAVLGRHLKAASHYLI